MTNPTAYVLSGQTRFEFDEFVASPDTIVVEYDDGGGAFVPVLPTEYTVEGIGVKGGVVIDYPNAPTSGTLRITLFANPVRLTDFTAVAAITPEALNAEFDHTLIAAGNGNIDHENRITQNEADIATNQTDIDNVEARLATAEPTIADLDANAMRKSGGNWQGQGLPLNNLGAPTGANYAARLADVLTAAATGLPDPTGLSRYALVTDGAGPSDFFWALVNKLAPLIDTLDLTGAGFNLDVPQLIAPPRTQHNPFMIGLLAEELVNSDLRRGATVTINSTTVGAPDAFPGGTDETVVIDDNPGSWAVYNDDVTPRDLGIITIEVIPDASALIRRRGNDAWRPAINFRNDANQLTDAIKTIKVTTKTGGSWNTTQSVLDRDIDFGGSWPFRHIVLMPHFTGAGADLEGVRFELITDTPIAASGGNFAIAQVLLYHANGPLLANLSPSWRDLGALTVPQLGAKSRTTHSFVAADAAVGFDAVYRMLVNGVSKARIVYDSADAMTRWWNDVIGTYLFLRDTGGTNGVGYYNGASQFDLLHDGNKLAKLIGQLNETHFASFNGAAIDVRSIPGTRLEIGAVDTAEIATDAIGSDELAVRTGTWSVTIPNGSNSLLLPFTGAPFNLVGNEFVFAFGKSGGDFASILPSLNTALNPSGYPNAVILHRRDTGTGGALTCNLRLLWLHPEA